MNPETQKQFEKLCALMNAPDVTNIICATDAGREGELIFRLVYEKAGCQKPVRRLWISSMEESTIQRGICLMKNLGAYDHLYQAALCRAQADWLVGMNATRFYSLLYGPTLPIGRVMTPTLAMIVQREEEIRRFKSTPFFTVKLETASVTARSERIADLNEARTLMKRCNREQYAVVKQIQQKHHTENPPLLYDLTSLQRDANKLCGYTAQQTLDYAQSLYEKKLLTYPRTDSRYLTLDMRDGLDELADRVRHALPFAAALELHAHPDRVIDDSKVSDHHAIIPTAAMPDLTQTIHALTSGELDLLHLVCARFLCALDDPLAYDETTVTLLCGEHEFTARGKRMTHMGWQRIWYAFRGSLGNRLADEEACQEEAIPTELAENMRLPSLKASLEEGKTTPPAHHTEATILHAMEIAGAQDMPEDAEQKGIGTPATRATILEKLIETKLLERVGEKRRKVLLPTPKGKGLFAMGYQIYETAGTAAFSDADRNLGTATEENGAGTGKTGRLYARYSNVCEGTDCRYASGEKRGTAVSAASRKTRRLPQVRRGCHRARERLPVRKPNLQFRDLEKQWNSILRGKAADLRGSQGTACNRTSPQNRFVLRENQCPLSSCSATELRPGRQALPAPQL